MLAKVKGRPETKGSPFFRQCANFFWSFFNWSSVLWYLAEAAFCEHRGLPYNFSVLCESPKKYWKNGTKNQHNFFLKFLWGKPFFEFPRFRLLWFFGPVDLMRDFSIPVQKSLFPVSSKTHMKFEPWIHYKSFLFWKIKIVHSSQKLKVSSWQKFVENYYCSHTCHTQVFAWNMRNNTIAWMMWQEIHGKEYYIMNNNTVTAHFSYKCDFPEKELVIK